MPSYQIRLLETASEMRATEKLTDEIGHGGELDIVPSHMITAIIHNGGFAFGAFENEQMLGYIFGFPGFSSSKNLQLKHCSHQMGVHPDHRGKNIGFALKKAQRQMVRQQGLDLITWTYDPLLSRNAYLNIARLGAVCALEPQRRQSGESHQLLVRRLTHANRRPLARISHRVSSRGWRGAVPSGVADPRGAEAY